MKYTSDLIVKLYESGQLSNAQIMAAVKAKILQIDDAKDILGPEYVEPEKEQPPLITDEIEERLRIMQSTLMSEMDKKIANVGELSFPDVVQGGKF